MTTLEMKLVEMGLEVAKMKGEYDTQLREIDYLRSALQAKQNFIKSDVSRRLPTTEDIKRWYQLLVGVGEEKMKADIEATFG